MIVFNFLITFIFELLPQKDCFFPKFGLLIFLIFGTYYLFFIVTTFHSEKNSDIK